MATAASELDRCAVCRRHFLLGEAIRLYREPSSRGTQRVCPLCAPNAATTPRREVSTMPHLFLRLWVTTIDRAPSPRSARFLVGALAALVVLLGLWPEPLVYLSGAAADVLLGGSG